MTQQVQTTLHPYLLTLNQNLLNAHDTQHVFLMTVHDWLSHLTDMPGLWPLYDSSLKEMLYKGSSGTKDDIHPWYDKVFDTPLTINALLYRHYLVQIAMDQEIPVSQHGGPLYLLMVSMVLNQTVFAPIDTTDLWGDVDTAPHPINSLRHIRPSVQSYIRVLAMRDDDTPYPLIHDHGLLSSLTLLYSLYLIHVILVYEIAIKPSKALRVILESSMDTLIRLKGVLPHVENQWFCPYVHRRGY